MIKVRRSAERGFEDKGWLQTFHTFSFDTYHDPEWVEFRQLRVLNQDTIRGGKGFGSHSHKDMEILTYVLEGALEHQDSIGNVSLIRPGEVQRMSAGSGIMHREYNLSHVIPVHFLQIWIYPEHFGLEPDYAKKLFTSAAKWGQWCLLASRNGREGSLRIHQDVDVYATLLDDHDVLTMEVQSNRHFWIQIVSGEFVVLDTHLKAGDGMGISEIELLEVTCKAGGELLLFDLA